MEKLQKVWKAMFPIWLIKDMAVKVKILTTIINTIEKKILAHLYYQKTLNIKLIKKI